jgi:hypothetical protein
MDDMPPSCTESQIHGGGVDNYNVTDLDRSNHRW